jgi:hypothetical protein
MLISSAFGLENVHRLVRDQNLWRGLQPLKPLVIDRDKALVNTVSMKAVAAEGKASWTRIGAYAASSKSSDSSIGSSSSASARISSSSSASEMGN